jgi:hypothetical protein
VEKVMKCIEILEGFGITRLSEKDFEDQDVLRLEKQIGCKLPDDYRFFLQKYGESDLESWVVFPTKGGGVFPGTFMGLDIFKKIEDCLGRLPDGCIPINDDGGNNLIVLSLDQDRYGEIYFQHHSVGVDQSLNNREGRWKTLTFLAKDFCGFIQGLMLDE